MIHQELKSQHKKHSGISTYAFESFCHHYQIALLDYVRFLIGAMWGAVTPDSCSAFAQDINQGMHKRSAEHLVFMVNRADAVLSKFEKDGLLLTTRHNESPASPLTEVGCST